MPEVTEFVEFQGNGYVASNDDTAIPGGVGVGGNFHSRSSGKLVFSLRSYKLRSHLRYS